MSTEVNQPSNITFADLEANQKEQTQSNGQKNSYPSQLAALNFFKTCFNIPGTAYIEPYFEHDQTFEQYLTDLDKQKSLSDKTLGQYKSRLRNWRKSALCLIRFKNRQSQTIPEIIKAALPSILEKKKILINDVINFCGMTRCEFAAWRVAGKTAFRSTKLKRERGARLEEILELPKGMITGKLWNPGYKVHETTRREYLSSRDPQQIPLNQIRYKPVVFPQKVAEFVSRYKVWKTTKRIMTRLDGEALKRVGLKGKSRSRGWRVHPVTGICESAGMFEGRLGAFYGWLMLPDELTKAADHVRDNLVEGERRLIPQELERLAPYFLGKGLSVEQLSVAHFLDPEMQSDFMEWRKRRGLVEDVGYVNDARSLLEPICGFVSQQVEYVWDYHGINISPVDMSGPDGEQNYLLAVAKWKSRCAMWLEPLASLVPDVIKSKERVRAKLAPILGNDDLMGVLQNMVNRHANSRHTTTIDSKAKGSFNLAVWHRDQLLLRMMISNPLRNRNYREMTYMSNNKGNLYQKNGLEWWIRFNPEDFKNERGAANIPYDVPLPKEVWPYVRNYIASSRPILLAGRSNTNNVFLTIAGETLDAGAISGVIFGLTSRYMPEELGSFAIRTHAFRHIIATAWLREHPEDYLTVALILHDRIQTVINNYAHIKASDGFNRYNRWLSTRFS